MTIVTDRPDVRLPGPAVAPRRGLPALLHRTLPALLRGAGSWAPAIVVAGAAVAALLRSATPAAAVAVYAAYLLFGLALPGTLLWRSLRGRARSFQEDVAGGTVFALAVEALAFLACRAAGVPRLTLAWPALVIMAFITVPRLRRHWRRPEYERTFSPAWAWSVAAVLLALVWWAYTTYFATTPIDGSGGRPPYLDLEFHLALAGEVANHVPPQVPYLAGEPLQYHWLGYAHLAAAHTLTGVDLSYLLLRLWFLPVLAATVVLTAVLATRVAGRAAAGPVAAALAWLAAELVPYGWTQYVVVTDLRFMTWGSPTLMMAHAYVAAALVLVVDVIRREASRGCLVLLPVILAVASGTKAPAVPVLGAGLAVVVLFELVGRRRLHLPALLAGAWAGAATLFSGVVLLGGSALGLALTPLGTVVQSAPGRQVRGFDHGLETDPGALAALSAIVLAALLVRYAAAVVLPFARASRRDPVLWALAGMTVAGLGVTLLTRETGGSELSFFRSALPVPAVLAAAGMVRCASVAFGTRRARRVAGAGLAVLVPLSMAAAAAVRAGHDDRRELTSLAAAAQPWLDLAGWLGLAALAFVVLVVAAGGVRGRAAVAAAVLSCTVAAAGACVETNRSIVEHSAWLTEHAQGYEWQVYPRRYDVNPRFVAAAHWLRAHSTPDDLVATNNHSVIADVPRVRAPACGFSVAAYTERRTLVQGWAFTVRAVRESERVGGAPPSVPFWDPALLAANDRAFTAPSARSVAVLRDRYHVRWLFADRRLRVSPDLSRYAARVYANDIVAVYLLG